jgi:hypothetical protein
MKTTIQFDIIKVDENGKIFTYLSSNKIFIDGWVNIHLLNEFLSSDDYLSELTEDIEIRNTKTMTLEIWEDSDDYRSWLDYKIISIE